MEDQKAEILQLVCAELEEDRLSEAAELLATRYPFVPLESVGRNFKETHSTQLFCRDGFIDLYSGKRLVFPPVLRLISHRLGHDFPTAFPYHPHWKTDACHFAYWELTPTVDHVQPVSRGGSDNDTNWITTSMMLNAAKSNFTLEEIGWKVWPQGKLEDWDGLLSWFLRVAPKHRHLWKGSSNISSWERAALKVQPLLPGSRK